MYGGEVDEGDMVIVREGSMFHLTSWRKRGEDNATRGGKQRSKGHNGGPGYRDNGKTQGV